MATEQKAFHDLEISTKTVMAYPNCSFYVNRHLWESFPINEITPPNAKKSKHIKNPQQGFYQIKGEWGTRGLPSKKRSFRNQITVVLYCIDRFINIKIFPTGKFHMTGCKDKRTYTLAAIKLLNTIRSFHTVENPTYIQTKEDKEDGVILPQKGGLMIGEEKTVASLIDKEKDQLSIIFDVVMTNVDFNIGFKVDQVKLANVLYENNLSTEFYPVYESTTSTSVNIKLDYPDPEVKTYDKYFISNDLSAENPIVKASTVFECKKIKDKVVRTHTFLVFSSSKVIQSGGFYDTEMKSAYYKFRKFITENRDKIEVKLIYQKFDFSQLRGLNHGIAVKA